MMALLRGLVGLIALGFLGCSSDDEDTGQRIDCSWFAAPNCWQEVADAAYACSQDAEGTFDAAHSQCIGPDVKVTFGTPVPEDLFEDDNYKWNITVSRGATECVRVVETEGGIEVKSSAGQFRQFLQGSLMVLECPNGSRYSMDALSTLSCGLDRLPGYSYNQLPSQLNYDLLGGSDRGTASLFTCLPPK